ncbi:MAG: OsmC family protein [Ignavibacteriaceae bacterium]
MKVELKRIDKDYHMQAAGSAGVPVDIDGAEAIGGHNAGARPMELMLMSLGGCSAIDIISILRKQKIEIEDFSISVDGEREADKTPSLFTNINVHFRFTGQNLDENKVKRAVELSMDKYCSAAAVLRKTAIINYTFSIEEHQ